MLKNPNMIKIADDSKVGFHYISPDKSITAIKDNNTNSWVVYKNNVRVESFGIGFNALVFATELQMVAK